MQKAVVVTPEFLWRGGNIKIFVHNLALKKNLHTWVILSIAIYLKNMQYLTTDALHLCCTCC